MEAAVEADRIRNSLIDKKQSFIFETVLSTDRNLKLLQRAKDNGYFIRCIYVLTSDPKINVNRVEVRTAFGGHSVPKDRIISRYGKALDLIPEFLKV